MTTQYKKLFMLIGIALVFLAPIVLAYFWQPTEFKNRGELIQPPRPLAEFKLMNSTQEPVGLDLLYGKWTMITFAGANCASECREKLTLMRQTQLAQGKHAHRVQSAWAISNDLSFNDPDEQSLNDIQDAFPDLHVLVAAESEMNAFTTQFQTGGEKGFAADAIYLIDPLGNIMMRYDSKNEIDDMAKDLRRLLRVSRIG